MAGAPRNLRNRRKHHNKTDLLTTTFSNVSKLVSRPSDLFNLIKNILFDPKYTFFIACLLVPLELILNLLVVNKISCKSNNY
jgi:hypothetical protein